MTILMKDYLEKALSEADYTAAGKKFQAEWDAKKDERIDKYRKIIDTELKKVTKAATKAKKMKANPKALMGASDEMQKASKKVFNAARDLWGEMGYPGHGK